MENASGFPTPSSSRPRTPAFHVGNTGSNPVGVASETWRRSPAAQVEAGSAVSRRGREGPRVTPIARTADLHLAVRPGTDSALNQALLHELIAGGFVNESFVRALHRLGGADRERCCARRRDGVPVTADS